MDSYQLDRQAVEEYLGVGECLGVGNAVVVARVGLGSPARGDPGYGVPQ